VPPVPVRRFTVDEYHQMIEAGILHEDDPVELLEGWIVPKMGRNPPHDAMISVITMDVLPQRVPPGWFFRGQSAVTTTTSEPEPDVAVIRGRARDYFDRHPGPAEMALVIEVADSSLARDRSLKGRIYAAASVPVYWIINIVDHQIQVYTDPTGLDASPLYRTCHEDRLGDFVPLIIDGRDLGPIPAQELLP
jgi:Uma2 family endonuclease